MRLGLDTSVLVSAFLWEGAPGRPIKLAGKKESQHFNCRALLHELAAVDAAA